MLNIAIAGASGRMGQMLLTAMANDSNVSLSAAFNRGDNLDAALANANVLIDFTQPQASLLHLAACKKHNINAVIGTTGFTTDEKNIIAGYAKHIAIVLAPNTSLGVNVTAQLVAMAAATLGLEADIEVYEAHHKMKVDAPSGTALMLGETAAEARGQILADVAVYDRHAKHTTREAGSIGFTSVRAGDIIGDHTVFFALNGERIEITHKSQSRSTYAHGALRAAKFLCDKSSGLYDMQDVLGLKVATDTTL
jgi:4-hydroxy-tetrahydrodipicolinate reductase